MYWLKSELYIKDLKPEDSTVQPIGAKWSFVVDVIVVGIAGLASWYISKSVVSFGSVSHIIGFWESIFNKPLVGATNSITPLFTASIFEPSTGS